MRTGDGVDAGEEKRHDVGMGLEVSHQTHFPLKVLHEVGPDRQVVWERDLLHRNRRPAPRRLERMEAKETG